jgi:hypothetical protein
MILRKEDGGSYKWITDAYMYGVMNGEAMGGLENGTYVKEFDDLFVLEASLPSFNC